VHAFASSCLVLLPAPRDQTLPLLLLPLLLLPLLLALAPPRLVGLQEGQAAAQQ
jgi:hypothetical protein